MNKRGKIVTSLVAIMLMLGSVKIGMYVKDRIMESSSKGCCVTNKDNSIEAVAKNDREGGAVCYITVKEGEKLVVKSDIEKGEARVKLSLVKDKKDSKEVPHDILELLKDENKEAEFDETFKDKGSYEFELPAGDYEGIYTSGKKTTTGKLVITSEAK
ncbi:MAG: hypothetical protein J6Y29_01795 [Clostridiales bacterium]|nr:hypothetical protein [Clostridiales bacterium]